MIAQLCFLKQVCLGAFMFLKNQVAFVLLLLPYFSTPKSKSQSKNCTQPAKRPSKAAAKVILTNAGEKTRRKSGLKGKAHLVGRGELSSASSVWLIKDKELASQYPLAGIKPIK